MLQLLTSYAPNHKSQVLEVVTSALDAGIQSIQFCWENSTDLEKFKLAEKLRLLTNKYNANLTINNRVDIALAVGADSIHLGQLDLPIKQALSLIPKTMSIGLTVSSVSELLEAESLPLDYYGIGPIFNTVTKPSSPIGLVGLQELKNNTNKSILAIGGISKYNIDLVRNIGVTGVSVIGAIYNSQDKYKASLELVTLFNNN